MRVVKLKTLDEKERYMLVDTTGEPVMPVLKYLKFRDNAGAARNSLRSYCQHLKLYFEFLEQEALDYKLVGIDDLASFLRWLQNPYKNKKITSLQPQETPRQSRTINSS